MCPALALHSLKLSHFRSHKFSQLDVGARSVAIFGPNGSGKTNILEAISLLSPGRGIRRARTEEIARKPENIGWKISAEIALSHDVHHIETGFDGSGSRNVVIDDTEVNQIALGEYMRLAWLVPVMDRLWLDGADGRRRFLDRMVLSFDPSHAKASIAYEKAMRERNRMLKDGVRDTAWYDAVEDQLAMHGAKIERIRTKVLAKVVAAQSGAHTAFPAATLQLVNADGGIPIADEAELKAKLCEVRGQDMAAGRTLVGPHRDDLRAVYAEKEMPAKDCSTGEQKALLISLVLANGRALKDDFGAPPILLLDEVAAHLDASRRDALYSELDAMGAQAWMTGTGPELFSGVQGDVLHLQVSDGEMGTQLLPI
ncbi:MAG: DNA replication/repair protein RecF [Pseudomonadota bacterium]